MTTEDTNRGGQWVAIGGLVDRVTISLRVFGDDLDPDEVSRLLGCQPTKCQVKGEVIVGRHSGLRREARTGSWILESDDERSMRLDEQIVNLLARVTRDLAAWEELTERYKADLFCGLFLEEENRACRLSAEVMRRLAERGLSIGFDIYAVFDGPE
jgi:hypothetical protein